MEVWNTRIENKTLRTKTNFYIRKEKFQKTRKKESSYYWEITSV